MIVHIDIETYSEVNLTKCGLYRYAEDASTRIHCVAWRIGTNNAVNLWAIPSASELHTDLAFDSELEALPTHEKLGLFVRSAKCPPELADILSNENNYLVAFNAQFERVMLNSEFARHVGVPKTSGWLCAMAKASNNGLPLSLGNATKVLGTHEKSEDGRGVMLMLSRPRKKGGSWSTTRDRKEFTALYDYCIDDVLAESELWHSPLLDSLSMLEQLTYDVDQWINDKGVLVDLEFVGKARKLHEEYASGLAKSVEETTGGISISRTQALREWLGSQGCVMADMTAQTVRNTLRSGVNGKARKVLRHFTEANKKAPMKFTAIENAVCSDGRLRGMFTYGGASTLRWAGRIVQLHNLKRPPPDLDTEKVADSLRDVNDPGMLEVLWGYSPSEVLGSCVRSAIVPSEGNSLVVVDFSQVESRVLAWLAGQENILKAYANGQDVYKLAASSIYGKPPDKITGPERFIGKTATLALGYQGGVGAFNRMSQAFGVDAGNDETIQRIVTAWRQANSKIVAFWKAIQSAFIQSGYVNGNVAVEKRSRYTKIKLPSGRFLRYWDPTLTDEGVKYSGVITGTGQWGQTLTYGGRLTENVVQAVARDLLAWVIQNLGFTFGFAYGGAKIVAHVHDEVICEVKTDSADKALAEITKLMSEPPEWAEGLPLAAEGYISQRYRK